MFTGKILTTMVAITTAVILLSQLNASSEIIPDIYEPYVNYALRPILETTCEPDCHNKQHKLGHHGKKLTGEFPDTVFVSTRNLEPTSVMSTGTNIQGNTIGMGGLGLQAAINGHSVANTEAAFANFETASGVVDGVHHENYKHKQKSCGCVDAPCKCGSNNGYGQQNTLPSDYSPFDMTTTDLPTTGMIAYELPMGEHEEMNAQGEIMPVICRSRLMYSTMKRFGYAQSDFIRGDLPIPSGCQTVSKTAARAGDSLNAGAFQAMFGLNNESAQSTAALIAYDTGGAVSTLGGTDLSEAVATSDYIGPVLTDATFLSNSAQLYLDQTSGTQERSVATNTAWGEVAVDSNRAHVVTGYTGF